MSFPAPVSVLRALHPDSPSHAPHEQDPCCSSPDQLPWRGEEEERDGSEGRGRERKGGEGEGGEREGRGRGEGGEREGRGRGKGGEREGGERRKEEGRGRVSRIIMDKQVPHRVSKMVAIIHWYKDYPPYLGCNLLFELVNLVGHDLQFALHLGDLVPGLNQVLTAQVAITTHCFIESLCEIESGGERC